MANWNKLTERQFSAIKTLLKGGASQTEAAEYMQVSPNTAYWVSKSETYEEYQHSRVERDLTRKQVAAIKAKESEPQKPQEVIKEVRQTVTIQATHFMMQELQKTNNLLTLISNKLGFIVDELCGTVKKDG